MCGIVGYIGPQNSIQIVMEGLKRLEYRGYDSSGISFVDQSNQLQCFKSVGKIEELSELLEGSDYQAQAIIGHTRWATHGVVNQMNAHPHMRSDLSLVHNGIIENCEEIGKELEAAGYQLQSETDTEIFLVLVLSFMERGTLGFRSAVVKAFSRVQGNSAFVVLNGASREIVTIKRGAPLVCGINKVNSQVFVSSDPYALMGMASKL